ncbi:MAG: SIS domain-containing protein, partial [Phycisphaerales bacterium]|nr:SIS domain-containing protein [Phycisphaerales bacterium]
MADDRNVTALERAADVTAGSLREGGKVLACGNGGSACDA